LVDYQESQIGEELILHNFLNYGRMEEKWKNGFEESLLLLIGKKVFRYSSGLRVECRVG